VAGLSLGRMFEKAWVTYATLARPLFLGVSLQLDSARSRRAKLVSRIFLFYFCSKIVSVVTFGVKLMENSFGIDVGVGDIIW
jgi:hypothetical protein